jgi:hypothetical protein
MYIHGPGMLGPCMFVECGDVSSQWEFRYVKVTLKIPYCVAFKGWQMSGILREAKSHRHLLGKDYEIKRKEH